MTLHSVVLGVGSALPKRKVTNDELAERVDTSDQWIVERTGIRSRYVAENGETTASLATEAARRALNVAFGVEKGRNFIHRKLRDIASSFILIGLVLITLIFVFLGGTLADHVFGHNGAHAW